MSHPNSLRHDWTHAEIQQYYDTAFNDLLFQAHCIHRQNFDPNAVQLSTLLSIKTGMCPEDCGYCSQSGLIKAKIDKHQMLSVDTILEKARLAKKNGATRFCMGGAWRNPPQKVMDDLCHVIKEVKALGLETCVTVGMLNQDNAQQLSSAGLDYYNHNIDTSPEHYPNIVTTRTFQDRLDTLEEVRAAGMQVCCGGILGMGETITDRLELLRQLANQTPHPGSVPINKLVPIKGTRLENAAEVDTFEFVRIVAVARILMPKSFVRLSAGRNTMSAEMQALCFFAGANSIHTGDKLLTTDLPSSDSDQALLRSLNIKAYTEDMLQSLDSTAQHHDSRGTATARDTIPNLSLDSVEAETGPVMKGKSSACCAHDA